MEHDLACEKGKVVFAIHKRLSLSAREAEQLKDDSQVELCFCSDRAQVLGFAPTYSQIKDRASRGLELMIQTRRQVAQSYAQSPTDPGGLGPGPGLGEKLRENVILVDFRHRRRLN